MTGNGLYLLVVIWRMVYYCFTHIIKFPIWHNGGFYQPVMVIQYWKLIMRSFFWVCYINLVSDDLL